MPADGVRDTLTGEGNALSRAKGLWALGGSAVGAIRTQGRTQR
jgi:hypothetical protein